MSISEYTKFLKIFNAYFIAMEHSDRSISVIGNQRYIYDRKFDFLAKKMTNETYYTELRKEGSKIILVIYIYIYLKSLGKRKRLCIRKFYYK